MFPENISKNFDKVREIAFSDLPIEEKMKLFESFDEILIEDFAKGYKYRVKNCFLPIDIDRFDEYAINPFGKVIVGWYDGAHLLSMNKSSGRVKLSNGRYDHTERSVHILVAKTFLQNPENKKYVNFKDGNRDNVRLDNLEFDNVKRTTINKSTKVPRVRKEKLSDVEINQISAMIDAGESSRKIAKKFNINRATVSYIWIAKEYGVNPVELFDITLQTTKPKKVKCLENGKIYESYSEAARDLKLCPQAFPKYFLRVAIGWDTDLGGYHFMRIEEKEI